MPLFGRKKTEPAPAPEPEPVAPEPVTITGDRPCSQFNCGRTDAAPCAYLDRRGRRCDTAFCPDHQAVFDGRPFCRRHVGTLRAIGIDVVDRALAPDLDNRAPSLVNWICNDLDERIRTFLSGQIPAGSGEELGEERVHLIRETDGARRWDRAWKLFDHTGVTTKVSVTVDESDDTTVIIRLGREQITTVVPPWIERRKLGVTVTPEEDAAERAVFYEMIAGRIEAAVIRERTAPPRY
jgi:hypothetical protein